MFRLLLDTCVWLDILKDPQQTTILNVMDTLVQEKELEFVVPRIVIAEFNRNKERVAQESVRSFSSALKRVREAAEKYAQPRSRKVILKQLGDLDHRIPVIGGIAAESIGHIEVLLNKGIHVECSEQLKLRAAQRALDGKAPFHRQKNSICDAVIIETYGEAIKNPLLKGRFGFVTHNTKDFSDPIGNDKNPHPDLLPLFSKIRSLYFIKLIDALKRVHPGLVSELVMDFEGLFAPRELSDVQNAIGELIDKIWYNRHQNLRYRVKVGRERIVSKEEWDRSPKKANLTTDSIWKGALRAAKEKEKRYGKKNLGPWTDFEWGMLNGKLSALRWALGDEWDMLDT